MIPLPFKPLAAFDQWTLYRKADKVPIDYRTGVPGDHLAPSAWLGYDAAVLLAGDTHGVGFVFTESDPFFFLDIDTDKHTTTAGWSQSTLDLVAMFPGAAVEVSLSGRGLHIIGRGECPPHGCKYTDAAGTRLDFFTKKHYVAMTGTDVRGDAGTDHTAALGRLVTQYFPENQGGDLSDWTTEAVPAWNGPASTAELVKRIRASKPSAASVFNGKATVVDLLDANETALAATYTVLGGSGSYDASAADLALAQHLAFWTGKNCEAIEEIMRDSELTRPKWDRHGYLQKTIMRACGYQADDQVYATKPAAPELTPVETAALEAQGVRVGYQTLPLTQVIERFEDYVYIASENKILTPAGDKLNSERFNNMEGGYMFELSTDQSVKPTKKAWDAVTQSQGYFFPKASRSVFRPLAEPGAMIGPLSEAENKYQYVNSYVDIEIESRPGDASPFYRHLEALLPDDRDRKILLSYMAAIVQYKGIKFQWCPLIQGTEGNGKTLFSYCVSHAIGTNYSHFPKAQDIDNKFNSWLRGKIFIAVEDIYVHSSRKEVMEALKPMITGRMQDIQAKGEDQCTEEICANFILNSNHKDALIKNSNDRRFCMLYTAQQCAEDIVTHGLGGNHLTDLYKWLDAEGYAIVAHELQTYAIPDEFNPAGSCHRAPETTSTREAIEMSRGGVEQSIIEAVDSHRVGFCGGWVSMKRFDDLLKETRNEKIKPSSRGKILEDLGYYPHPALTRGRVNNPIPGEGRTKLYISRESVAMQLTRPKDVAEAYTEAQSHCEEAAAAAVFGGVA